VSRRRRGEEEEKKRSSGESGVFSDLSRCRGLGQDLVHSGGEVGEDERGVVDCFISLAGEGESHH
jgi:hypothetical protein